MKKYYHLFSNGDDAHDFILCDGDYMAALARIGICSVTCGCEVVAFDIESTHIHILLYGTLEECNAFKAKFKKLSMMYISQRADTNDAVLNVQMYEIGDAEYLKNVAAYVAVQCTKNGRGVMFYDYLWSSGPLYFRSTKADIVWCIDKNGRFQQPKALGELSYRERRQVLHSTDSAVPDSWLTCNGILLPSNFVSVGRFERLFRTHNAFRCFCASGRDKDKAIQDSMASVSGVSMEEEEARNLAVSFSMRLFGTPEIRSLDTGQRLSLARALRKEYHIGLGQIARRVHLPEKEIRKYLL